MMGDSDKERKIKEAMEANADKWDEKYSQKDWKGLGPKKNKVVAKRVKGGIAAKAMKNIW
jgi:hypothetical protein